MLEHVADDVHVPIESFTLANASDPSSLPRPLHAGASKLVASHTCDQRIAFFVVRVPYGLRYHHARQHPVCGSEEAVAEEVRGAHRTSAPELTQGLFIRLAPCYLLWT